jgi:hypothetical protein
MDFGAAGVTDRADVIVSGRMDSDPVLPRARLTMRAPVWYRISPGP